VHSPVADTSTLVDRARQQQQQKQNPTKKHKHPTEKRNNQSLELAAGMDRLLAAAAEVIPVCY
jgi:hypothetical protein